MQLKYHKKRNKKKNKEKIKEKRKKNKRKRKFFKRYVHLEINISNIYKEDLHSPEQLTNNKLNK